MQQLYLTVPKCVVEDRYLRPRIILMESPDKKHQSVATVWYCDSCKKTLSDEVMEGNLEKIASSVSEASRGFLKFAPGYKVKFLNR